MMMTTQANISYEEIQRRVAEGLQLRSEFWTALLSAAVRRIGRSISAAAERTRQARRYSSTVRALSELSDYTLRDIGLDRDQILAVSHEVAKSPRPTRPLSKSFAPHGEQATAVDAQEYRQAA